MSLNELELATRAVNKLMLADKLILAELGIEAELIERGRVILKMKVSAKMVTSQSICHGGFVFTLADTAGAYAVASMNVAPVTTEANVSFITPAMKDDVIRAEARIELASDRTIHSLVRVFKKENEFVALYKGTNLNRGSCIEALG